MPPDILRADVRKKEALELRREGKSYPEIAKELGCVTSAAHKMVQRALEKWTEECKEEAEQTKAIELQRLDELVERYHTQAKLGDIKAGEFVLKLMERRAKLLGLDAAVKVEGSLGIYQQLSDMSDAELEAQAARVGLTVVKEVQAIEEQINGADASDSGDHSELEGEHGGEPLQVHVPGS